MRRQLKLPTPPGALPLLASDAVPVLRHRAFRLLFLGQAASTVGDQIVLVALPLYVTRLTASPTAVGIVVAAQVVPFVALLLFGGVWADRLPRHRLMLATDIARALLHTLLAALIFAGSVRIWQLVVIEALFGAAQAFFQPAYSGLLPQTVPEELIQSARALTETVANLSRLIGPLLATLLVLGLGGGVAFALDAATFVLSALLLMQVNPRERAPATASVSQPASASGGTLALLRGGWHEVRSRTWVWVTILAFTGVVMCQSAPWQTLGPLASRREYGSIGVYGILVALMGAGSLLGSAVALRWRPRYPLRVGILLTLGSPLPNGLVALGAPIALLVPASLLSGFGFALLIIWWETSLARHIPPHALSRVSAWDWMGALALLPLGLLAAGPLASVLGPRAVLAGGCVGALIFLGAALIPRQTRDLTYDPRTVRAMSA